MKRFARLLGITVGLVALGFVVTLAPQKTASGTVAANVNVVNTAANPVINQDRDSEARGAFQTQMFLSISGTSGTGVLIPAGTRLVIDYVSIAASAPSSGTQPYVELFTTIGSGPAVNYTLTPTQSSLATQQFQHSEAVKIYADTLFVSLAFAGASPSFLTSAVTISGHLVNIP